MTSLILRRAARLGQPIEAIRARQAQADALIRYAVKLRDWPLLEQAVHTKIEDQQNFIEWWDGNIRGKGGGYHDGNVAERGHYYSVKQAETITGVTKQQVSRWRQAIFVNGNPDKEAKQRYHNKLVLATYRKANLEPAENYRADYCTGNDERFTPPEYIRAAREVMGNIHLDPASHRLAQKVVQADTYYTQQDDGLTKDWHGSVWLNPPFSQPQISQFVDKLVTEFLGGTVQQAILLTNNSSDTTWFHKAATHAAMLCFTRGRIRCVGPDGGGTPMQGHVLFYFGREQQRFYQIFTQFGTLLVLAHPACGCSTTAAVVADIEADQELAGSDREDLLGHASQNSQTQ